MPEDKEPIPKFAARIKAKYPEYRDLDDTLLTKKIIERYPEYADMVEMPAEPVKKKETSGTGSTPVLTDTETGMKYYDVTDKQIQRYQETKNKFYTPETEQESISFKNDPVKHIIAPARNKAVKASQDLRAFGLRNRNVSESTNQSGTGNAGKLRYDIEREADDSYKELEGLRDQAVKQLFPNGKAAEEYIKNSISNGAKIEGNETLNIAAQKAERYENIKQKINSGGSILQLPVNIAREFDPNLDKQISALEQEKNNGQRTGASGMGTDIYENVIPGRLQGQLVDAFIHDPDVQQVAEDNPGLKAEIEGLKGGRLFDLYPDYGEYIVRNELSRARQKLGKNNAIANPIFNSSKAMDKIAETLYKDDPAKLKLYNERLKGNLEGKIDTPGLVDEFATGASDAFSGMGRSLKDVVGLGDTEAERIYKGLGEGNVSSGIEGPLKYAGEASKFIGMMAAMGSVGTPARALGLSPTAANAIITADTFYDDELNKWTMKYPGDPLKAHLGALTTTAAYTAVHKIFPSGKVADAIAGKMTPEIKQTLANLSEGVVSKEAKAGIVDTFSKALKGTVEAGAHMAAINAFEQSLDKVMGDEQMNLKYHPDSDAEIIDVAKGMMIGSAFPQFMIAAKNRNAVANSLYDIAENPKRFTDVLEQSGEVDSKKMEDIDFLTKTKQELDRQGITTPNQKRFLLEAMDERYKKERVAQLPESGIARRAKTEISRNEQVQERILNGEDVAGNEDRAKLSVEETDILGKAKASAGEGLKISLEADHPDMEKVSFLKEQSIDTPGGLADQLGGNESLVTDIIATNNKVDIESRIKYYEEQLKNPDFNEVDFANIDRHLTLLEKGLEKHENIQRNIEQGDTESVKPPESGEATAIPESTTEGGQQAPGEAKEAVVGPIAEGEMTGITHAQMDAAARELGLDEYETNPETFEQWDKEASDRLKKPGSIEKVLAKMEKGRRVEPVENQMLKRYVASLKARINQAPTPELLAQFDKVKSLSNLAGRSAAKELVSRRGMLPVEDSLADYLSVRSGDKKRQLSETQIKEESAKYTEKKTAEQEYKESLSIDEQAAAEQEFQKAQKNRDKSQKKTKEQYVKEREDYRAELKAAKEKHEKWLKDQGIQQSGIGFTFTTDMAKAVGKIVKSHINEGVDKLNDLIDKVYEDVKDIFEGISKDDIRNHLIYGPEKKKIPLSKETIEKRDRLININKQIEIARQNDQYQNMSLWQKTWDKVQNFLGIRRLVQTSLDASIILRQLGQLAFNPRKWPQFYEAIKATGKILYSAKNFDRIMFEIKESPEYSEMVKDGVRFNDPEGLTAKERNELTVVNRKSFVYRLPLIKWIAGIPLSRSQKIADGTLNVARYELYNKYKKRLEDDKIFREDDPETYKEMAKLVMNTTGSGNLLQMFENPKSQKALGSIFYGARLMAANFNSLNPVYYAKITAKNKRLGYEAMKDLAFYAATIMATGAGLAAAGGKISLDPDSPDFLQIRFGDKVYDITGGKAAYIRTFLRLVEAGYARKFKTKNEAKKSMDFASKSLVRFFRNKLSPNTSYGVNFATGSNSIGQDFDPYEVIKIMPMYVDDAWNAAKEDGIISLLTVLAPNLLGIGYNSYYSEPSEQPFEDLLERNLRSDEIDKSQLKNFKEGGREITDKEFQNYADKRDSDIEKRLTVLYNKGAYVEENGKVVLKPFSKLTKEEIIAETSKIKSDATKKVKEEMFGEEKKSSKERRNESQISRGREKLYN